MYYPHETLGACEQTTHTNPVQRRILKALGVVVVPHYYHQSEELIAKLRSEKDLTKHLPTENQISFAKSLGIVTDGKQRQELSREIDIAAKQKSKTQPTQKAATKFSKQKLEEIARNTGRTISDVAKLVGVTNNDLTEMGVQP